MSVQFEGVEESGNGGCKGGVGRGGGCGKSGFDGFEVAVEGVDGLFEIVSRILIFVVSIIVRM